MTDSTGVVVILMTAPDREEAETIATALVEERLCACVNVVGPIRSIYRWQGKVERSDEFLCVAKTSAGSVAAVKARLPQLHSYEVPELLVLPIADGLPPYLAWVLAESSPS